MRQKKKLLLAGILCCMCLGSVCVSIGVRGRFPRKLREGQMQLEEQNLQENKQEYKEENRQEEAAAEQKEQSTETGTEKDVPNVPAPKTGDSWWK
ncbi:hypothetical protein [Faecalimonas umbilicata]|uniref:hypothetical protein n=1 Tax=Faecalimonas umbilicata TaxID=1912855 RepID=UPI0022E8895E|nr:hypothetical protein [Faecalimonas umbilicata]